MANDPYQLPPIGGGGDIGTVPISPSSPGDASNASIYNQLPSVLNGIGSSSGTNDISYYIKQFTIGIVDSFVNASEHLLIYTVFAVIFIMLLYVLVSDQSPGEIIVNTGKNASKASEFLPLLAE